VSLEEALEEALEEEELQRAPGGEEEEGLEVLESREEKESLQEKLSKLREKKKSFPKLD